jgi:large subunit ribosomal protein L6
MSRVAKNPITIPKNVDVKIEDNDVVIKGVLGRLSFSLKPGISVDVSDSKINIRHTPNNRDSNVEAGTTRAILNNMVVGVSTGFEKKLTLVGVGYRAQAKGNVLSLVLGFSHPVEYRVPNGITVETPSQTDILVKGSDRQLVGQVAANIRAYRPPEPYKGKGVRYQDEVIVKKEAKKK